MKNIEEAIAIISANFGCMEMETIQLDEANGRVLAENIYADRDYPPFNRAAMDGYAIMQSDWTKGIRKYRLIEVVFTGRAAAHPLLSGSCYKIMTGAATPESADLIIRIEDAEEAEGLVTLKTNKVRPYQNIARQGEDATAGTLLLTAPVKCTAQITSLLATLGKATLQAYRLPKVALLTTGDEIVNPSASISPLKIRNSNLYLLKALLEQWKIQPVLCEHVSDHKEELTEALKMALNADLVIINGAVSAGDADHVPEALRYLGVKTLFHKVSIRPGKPLLVGMTASGTAVFALPGNPLSCLTTYAIFVEHYLHRTFGFEFKPFRTLPLSESRTKRHALAEFFPVKISPSDKLKPIANNGSGDIMAFVSATGLALQPEASIEIKKNDLVRYYPLYH